MSKPLSYLAFCERIGIALEPGQRVLCAVAFDGIEPGSFTGRERELARGIFGDLEVVPPGLRAVLALVAGARSGKSYLFAAVRMLHLALSADVSRLAPGEIGVALIVGPDIRLAKQVLAYVSGIVAQQPRLKNEMLLSTTVESLAFDRGGGKRVAVVCLPATRGGSAVRGRSLVGAVLDEACFFRDDSYQVNDAELFRAIAPRIMKGGQLVIASTPFARAGMLYELDRDNWGKPTTCLAAHAATGLLRTDETILSYVERERQRDPDNARREFDAVFLATDAIGFFDPTSLERAVTPELPDGAAPQPGAVVTVGADFGFTKNFSALVVVHRYGDRYDIAEIVELRPQGGEPLKPSFVVGKFAETARAHGAQVVVADAHYREAVREYFAEEKLSVANAPEGASGKADTYAKVKSLLREGKVRLPKNDRLLRQLEGVLGRPTSGGGLSITSPVTPDGAHGDMVSALVLALWQAAGMTVAAADPPHGSQEWLRLEGLRAVSALASRKRAERAEGEGMYGFGFED